MGIRPSGSRKPERELCVCRRRVAADGYQRYRGQLGLRLHLGDAGAVVRLRALGVNEELAHSSIRFGLGRFNTEDEVDYVTDRVFEKLAATRNVAAIRNGERRNRS